MVLSANFTAVVFSGGVVFGALGSLGLLAAQELRPLENRVEWKLADEGAWKWDGEGEASVLSLVRQSEHRPKVRSPFNLAWFEGAEWGSFVLTAEVRLDLFNDGNNDLCVAFGKVGETKFYYAHLGQKADGVHLQIHVVDDADRRAITEERVDVLPWEPEKWHQVRLERDVESGSVKVWFDGREVLSATDATFGKGRIGLGSFDDLGSFRNVVIGEKQKED